MSCVKILSIFFLTGLCSLGYAEDGDLVPDLTYAMPLHNFFWKPEKHRILTVTGYVPLKAQKFLISLKNDPVPAETTAIPFTLTLEYSDQSSSIQMSYFWESLTQENKSDTSLALGPGKDIKIKFHFKEEVLTILFNDEISYEFKYKIPIETTHIYIHGDFELNKITGIDQPISSDSQSKDPIPLPTYDVPYLTPLYDFFLKPERDRKIDVRGYLPKNARVINIILQNGPVYEKTTSLPFYLSMEDVKRNPILRLGHYWQKFSLSNINASKWLKDESEIHVQMHFKRERCVLVFNGDHKQTFNYKIPIETTHFHIRGHIYLYSVTGITPVEYRPNDTVINEYKETIADDIRYPKKWFRIG